MKNLNTEILQIRYDGLYHDLINGDNMDIIEFIVMQILGLSYDMVHGKCIVKDSRITRASKKDRTKHVDLIIGYGIHELILEMNNNYLGALIRNIVYGMTRIVTFYQRYRKGMRNKKKKVENKSKCN